MGKSILKENKMNFKYNDVKNCKWGDSDHKIILCDVDFDHLDEVYVPFSATANDKYEHTKEIFARAKAGNFGVVAEFAPPPPPTTEELANIERLQRDALLSEVDSIVGNPLRWASFSQAQQQAWSNYRQALLDVPQQAGFPNTINWPTKPTI
jgi:hypothetical protein